MPVFLRFRDPPDIPAHHRRQPGRILRAPVAARGLLARGAGAARRQRPPGRRHLVRHHPLRADRRRHQLPGPPIAPQRRALAGDVADGLPSRANRPGRVSRRRQAERGRVQRIQPHRRDDPGTLLLLQPKEALGDLLSRGGDPAPEALFDILSDRSIAEDRLLPETGIGPEWERILSARFIASPVYGTRSSTGRTG